MKDVIVIPTYNERDSIGSLITEIFRIVPQATICVVDDNSPDGTAQVVRDMQGAYPALMLFVRPAKTGLGSAYIETFKKLLPDPAVRTITTMDADWSHNPNYLPQMFKESETHDVIIGCRYIKGGGVPKWEPWRRLLSRGGNLYARTVSGTPLHDLTAGFMTFRKEFLAKIPLGNIHSSGYAYLIEVKCLSHKLGARFKEIPIIFDERRGGESKLSRHIVREGLIAPWRARFQRTIL